MALGKAALVAGELAEGSWAVVRIGGKAGSQAVALVAEGSLAAHTQAAGSPAVRSLAAFLGRAFPLAQHAESAMHARACTTSR